MCDDVAMRTTARRALLGLLLLGGCAYSRGLRPDDRPSGSRAYIYGRFQMADNGHTNAMGFVLACTQGDAYETINIGLSRKHPIQVFEVLPGTCQVDETIYTSGSLQILGRRASPLAFLRNRELSPGVPTTPAASWAWTPCHMCPRERVLRGA